VTLAGDPVRQALLRRGFALEYVTLAWNVIGIVVLAIAAISARSVALAGFGLDSLIEIGASTVVIWELSATGEQRQRRGLQLIGYAFAALAVYLLAQSTIVLAAGHHPRHSVPGIIWTAVTAAVMFALAAGKARTGAALGNPVLQTEGRVTLIDGILATAVLAGLVLNAALGWWWADPRRRVRAGLSTPPAKYGTSSSPARDRRTACRGWARWPRPITPSRSVRSAWARPGWPNCCSPS
jgi:divalent metal cation (Fe/Co/Zn/Cd) transporter